MPSKSAQPDCLRPHPRNRRRKRAAMEPWQEAAERGAWAREPDEARARGPGTKETKREGRRASRDN